MPKLDHLPTLPYSDPWLLTYAQRCEQANLKKTKVAYFYEEANNSTFRYRAYNPVQVLSHCSNDISASFFFLEDEAHFEEIADFADKLVVCRSRYCERLARLIRLFRIRSKPVFFDIDDFVFDSDHANFVAKTVGDSLSTAESLDYWFAYTSRLGKALKLCDQAITTNPFLAEAITSFAGKRVNLLNNFYNREQAALSKQIFEFKQRRAPLQEKDVYLGYFSGSPSHNVDFSLILPALRSLMRRHERLHLIVAGYIESGELGVEFSQRVKYLPFTDYVNLQKYIGSVDFNLVPLQNNFFTNCKSELKYFEAAAVGTLTIASPTSTYRQAITHGDNGFLARQHEWEDVLEEALALDGDGYARMANRCQQHAFEHYAWTNQQHKVEASLAAR